METPDAAELVAKLRALLQDATWTPDAVLDLCESLERSAALSGWDAEAAATREWSSTGAAQALAYCFQDQCLGARFLLQRLPESQRADAQLQAAYTVAAALAKKDFPAMFAALAGHTWSPLATPVAERLAAVVREDNLALLAGLYGRVPVATLCELTGRQPDAARALAAERGWRAPDMTDAAEDVLQAPEAPRSEAPVSEVMLPDLAMKLLALQHKMCTDARELVADVKSERDGGSAKSLD